MKEEEHAVEILHEINNEDPINVDEVMIEELSEMVESRDDEEMDLTSEVTSPS